MDKETLFFKCPKCGIYGRAGKECEFCGELVLETDEGRKFDSLFPTIQTVSADVFAVRIAKFDNVDSFCNNLAIVAKGDLVGLINRNGEMILPLQFEDMNNRPGIINLKESGNWYTLKADEFLFYRYDDNERVSGIYNGELQAGQLLFASSPVYFIFDVNSRKRILTVDSGYIGILLDGYILYKYDPDARFILGGPNTTYLFSLISSEMTVLHPFDDPVRIRPIHYGNPFKEVINDPDALCFHGNLPGIKTPLGWSRLGCNVFTYKLDGSKSLEKQYNRMKQQFISDYEQEVRHARKKLYRILFGVVVVTLYLIHLMYEYF